MAAVSGWGNTTLPSTPPTAAPANMTDAWAAYSVHATDLDADGDLDVLSASLGYDKIAWYENVHSP